MLPLPEGALHFYDSLRHKESSRRRQLSTPERLAADAYIVKRGNGRTIIAGYPWFGDWGRDAFISLRGLCLANGRLADAQDILVQWSGAVSEGMLPNRFPGHGEAPEYNSVDASLWYIVAVHDYLEACQDQSQSVVPSDEDRQKLKDAVEAILTGYSRGTGFGIKADDDGLLSCGQPGIQLTWMDAKVGDWVVTPRVGKPVEVQALWLKRSGSAANLRQNGKYFSSKASEFCAPILERSRGWSFRSDRLRSPSRRDRSVYSSKPNFGGRRSASPTDRGRKSKPASPDRRD
jgi:predicted glycogen debranching enzyme